MIRFCREAKSCRQTCNHELIKNGNGGDILCLKSGLATSWLPTKTAGKTNNLSCLMPGKLNIKLCRYGCNYG